MRYETNSWSFDRERARSISDVLKPADLILAFAKPLRSELRIVKTHARSNDRPIMLCAAAAIPVTLCILYHIQECCRGCLELTAPSDGVNGGT
jgi:hypothetical protein